MKYLRHFADAYTHRCRFTTFTFVFEEHYGFSESTVGLVYIGCGVGNLLGLAVLGKISDPIMKYMAKKHNGGKPKVSDLLVYHT